MFLIQEEHLQYLSDEKFSNGKDYQIPKYKEELHSRIGLLENLAKGKNIIHLGCVDHAPLLEEKINSGLWLHNILTESSKTCIGIDINKEGIDILSKQYGVNNIIQVDIEKDELTGLNDTKWDYIVAADVLEHIGNPVKFLSSIRKKLDGLANEIIITVPNAFYLKNFMNSFKGKECINTDHRFWYTPFTVAKVLSDAGFRPLKFTLTNNSIPKVNFIKRHIYRKYPLVRENILIVASL